MDKIKIRLIIGLGNPGRVYENTRHNVGFFFVDELAKRLKTSGFALKKNLGSEITEASCGSGAENFKIVLAKPQTFMNKSGEAVASLMKFYLTAGNLSKGGKLKLENILIVHDDIDISFGKFKFSFGRSSAGHKGVESIIRFLKTKNFWRLRIGIQPAIKNRVSADRIVLKKFTRAETGTLDKIAEKAAEAICFVRCRDF